MENNEQPIGQNNPSYETSEGKENPSRIPWPKPEETLSASSLNESPKSQQQQLQQQHETISRHDSKEKKKSSAKLSCCQIFVLVSSAIMILFSIAMLAGGFDLMFDAILKSQMSIHEGTQSYDMWVKTPFPLILNLYVFNITNPEEVTNGGKPILKEIGPYVWREYHEKHEIEFHSNKTVTYLQQRWWVFDEELTGNRSLDDMVYSMNPIPLSSAYSIKQYPKLLVPFVMESMNKMFNDNDEKAIVKAAVNDLTFEGFEDPILAWIQENVVSENGSLHEFLPYLNLPPGLSDYDKFGWFYMRNMSLMYDGVFNVFTGADELEKVGQIDTWNYTRETWFFDSPCNFVTGSGGEYFPPGLQRDKVLFYSSDLCMSVALHYKEDIEIGGVTAYRFWGSKTTFDNGSTVPGYECYCVKGTCAPYGLLNAESCRMGSPSFISFPHYFNADPFLLDQVEGLSPDEDKHGFFMDIMPEAGVPLGVKARMQINMRVMPYPGKYGVGKIDILENLPDIYLPMIWFEVLADVTDDMISPLKMLQYFMNSPWIMIVVFSVMLAIGLIMMISMVVIRMRK